MNARDAVDRIVEKLRDWGSDLVGLLPNLAVAVLVLVAFALLAKLAKRLVHRALARFSTNVQVNELLASTVRLSILVAGLFIALGLLELDKTVTSLLAGVGVLGLALGFAFKDIAANYMSGVIIAVRVPFDEGDVVKIKDYFGRVESLDLRATGIRLPTGELVYLPNQEILQSAIMNYTRGGTRRVDIEVGVSYAEDLEKVRNVALDAMRSLADSPANAGLDRSREIELFFTGFGDSSIELVVRFWIRGVTQKDYMSARSAAVMAIRKAFEQNEITIPFPIRTLDFGVVGGQKLDEVLASAQTRRDGQERTSRRQRPS